MLEEEKFLEKNQQEKPFSFPFFLSAYLSIYSSLSFLAS